MKADEMRKDGIREWLLAGGGGFEGTPEASTFSFEGLIDYIDAFAMLAVDEALAREAGEPRNPEGALTPVGEENRLKQGTPPCCEFEWLGNRCSLPEGHEADHEIYDARRGEGMSELKVASRNPSSEAGLRAEGLKVREQILEPSFCGVNGHFKFQQNGNSCLMCQRESRLILLASRIRTADDLQFCDKDEVETVRAALAKEARDAGPRNATSCVVGIAIEPQHAPPGQPEIVKDCPGYQCLCCNRPSIYALQMRYVLSPLCNSCIKALREELAARDAAKETGDGK